MAKAMLPRLVKAVDVQSNARPAEPSRFEGMTVPQLERVARVYTMRLEILRFKTPATRAHWERQLSDVTAEIERAKAGTDIH